MRKWLTDSKLMFPGCMIRRCAALDDQVEPLLAELAPGSDFECDPDEGLNQAVADRLFRYFSK